jgi:hypothetical protein
MSAGDSPSSKPDDMLFVYSPSEQGDGYRVVRKRADSVEVGEIRAVQEGRPIHGEVVKLTPRPEHERLFNVDVLLPAHDKGDENDRSSDKAAGRSGPAQVATDAYRANWEAIFGGGRGSSDLN